MCIYSVLIALLEGVIQISIIGFLPIPFTPGWIFTPLYGILIHYFSKYKKTGIAMIILFFVPYVAVIVGLIFWLSSCPDMSVCLQDSFWDTP